MEVKKLGRIRLAWGTNPMKRFFATIQAKSTIILKRQLAMRDDCIRVSIEGADHADFYDKLYSPERWKQWRPWRPRIIRPERLRTVLDAYLVASQTEPAMLVWMRGHDGSFPAEPVETTGAGLIVAISGRDLAVSLSLDEIYTGIV